MNDRQMRNLIRQSAEDVEVPERLKPDKIVDLIQSAEEAPGDVVDAGRMLTKKHRRNFYKGYAVTAAVILAVCGLPLFGGTMNLGDKFVQKTGEQSVDPDSATGEMNGSGNLAEGEVVEKSKKIMQSKEDAGDLYRVAEDYSEVYDIVADSGLYWKYNYVMDFTMNGMPIEELEAADGGVFERTDVAGIGSSSPSAILKESAGNQTEGYSKTNVQTQGVDESDIVKTDGAYLYVVTDNRVHIVDIRKGKPKEATVLEMPSDTDSFSIKEIYVDDGKLLVITGEKYTQLKEIKKESGNMEISEYYTVTQNMTTLYTYSLDKPSKPELLGQVGQDGSYYTSRKIGDKVYLFTKESLAENCYGYDRGSDDWIPLAGGEMIASDCIYIPQQGGNSLIVSSIDTDEPEEIMDNVMIVNNDVNVYVSTEAVYLYRVNWNQEATTEIAKFSLTDGEINAVSASGVKGRVRDTFAINEYQNMLRILTASDNSNEGTNLYILDEQLKLTGKLEGIAPGETIYAARYLGDMAYFVTYRNIDPLFAVDLSDPSKPEILGELKITGYSEYLHMWEPGTMFGIGYETDPDTGMREGIKLSMFDVSNPADLQAADCICIANADYSPALDQYKTVLAEPQANLIGFVVTEYDRTQSNTYLLFEWKDGKFNNLLTQDVAQSGYYRGVYAGQYFYIVTSENVVAYDRGNHFGKVGELTF
ncbi:MAG: beta-propeller domain-containing protein [Lachnospiraceae bacterium]|nr:beta-propeller domain-containing protein [Lachnospiraceae bacterium]